jgi:hypothetical protein
MYGGLVRHSGHFVFKECAYVCVCLYYA